MKMTDKLESLGGVYIITNKLNGKVYVGETVNLRKRVARYLTEKTQVISRAIKKYGVENFDLYVEYLPDFDKASLLKLEEQLIIRFDSLVPYGYNVCPQGTDGTGRTHTQETKDKIGKAHKNKIVTKETRDKLSIALKGKIPTQDTIHKRTKHLSKPVIQLDKNTNNIIKEWPSAIAATKELSNGKNRSGDICRAIKGIKMKSAFGFKWKFKD